MNLYEILVPASAMHGIALPDEDLVDAWHRPPYLTESYCGYPQAEGASERRGAFCPE